MRFILFRLRYYNGLSFSKTGSWLKSPPRASSVRDDAVCSLLVLVPENLSTYRSTYIL